MNVLQQNKNNRYKTKKMARNDFKPEIIFLDNLQEYILSKKIKQNNHIQLYGGSVINSKKIGFKTIKGIYGVKNVPNFQVQFEYVSTQEDSIDTQLFLDANKNSQLRKYTDDDIVQIQNTASKKFKSGDLVLIRGRKVNHNYEVSSINHIPEIKDTLAYDKTQFKLIKLNPTRRVLLTGYLYLRENKIPLLEVEQIQIDNYIHKSLRKKQ